MSSEETPSTVNDSLMSCAELGKYLTNEYEILRRVFSYLSVEDLSNAASVCMAWESAAKVTKNRRRLIQSFFLSQPKYKMGTIWSEASFCIAFCTAVCKHFEQQVTEYMHPNGEFLLSLSSAGVIGTTSDTQQLVQQKIRVGLPLAPKKFYLSAMRFPDIPGVGIKTFVWEDIEPHNFQAFREKCDLPEDSIVKCLLILMSVEERIPSIQKDDFVSFLKSRQKENFAIGGCIIDCFVNYPTNNSRNSVTKYVVFYGKNVSAASTILTAEIKTITAINTKIEELKKMCPVTDSGILFVFRCAGRQRVVRKYRPNHDITSWEGKALTKNFPNTPMVGCIGYGEFGNVFPCQNNQPVSHSPLKRLRGDILNDYSYSTSLLYVGFNHQ